MFQKVCINMVMFVRVNLSSWKIDVLQRFCNCEYSKLKILGRQMTMKFLLYFLLALEVIIWLVGDYENEISSTLRLQGARTIHVSLMSALFFGLFEYCKLVSSLPDVLFTYWARAQLE